MEVKDFKPKYLRNTLITVLIIAVVASFAYFVVIRKINYNLGERYYLARLYPDAITKLKPLNNYQDSKSLYIRSLYKQGEIYYDSYNYKEAINYFEELSEVLPETSDLVIDAKYMMAIHEGVNERYSECINMLSEVNGYAKCSEMLEYANAKNNEPFVQEHRTHTISMEFKDVIGVYLNSK